MVWQFQFGFPYYIVTCRQRFSICDSFFVLVHWYLLRGPTHPPPASPPNLPPRPPSPGGGFAVLTGHYGDALRLLDLQGAIIGCWGNGWYQEPQNQRKECLAARQSYDDGIKCDMRVVWRMVAIKRNRIGTYTASLLGRIMMMGLDATYVLFGEWLLSRDTESMQTLPCCSAKLWACKYLRRACCLENGCFQETQNQCRHCLAARQSCDNGVNDTALVGTDPMDFFEETITYDPPDEVLSCRRPIVATLIVRVLHGS